LVIHADEDRSRRSVLVGRAIGFPSTVPRAHRQFFARPEPDYRRVAAVDKTVGDEVFPNHQPLRIDGAGGRSARTRHTVGANHPSRGRVEEAKGSRSVWPIVTRPFVRGDPCGRGHVAGHSRRGSIGAVLVVACPVPWSGDADRGCGGIGAPVRAAFF
jgi:hypothetical protein